MGDGARSWDRFEKEGLAILADAAKYDLAGFIQRNPHHASLKDRVLAVALCQGAAAHFAGWGNGVQDFDVWTFFADDGQSPKYPLRVIRQGEFRGQRFKDSTGRIDFLGRTINTTEPRDRVDIVCEYLSNARTESECYLASKPVVVLDPADQLGKIIWPGRSTVHQKEKAL